ncbi:molybdate ABC transporter substrate-binding protein [Pukyongiella litopenaei]|nr:molybdate ABC transporter substrate-binding protein [Pukyongiella litopenaei]
MIRSCRAAVMAAALAVAAFVPLGSATAQEAPFGVFAAASMKTALDEAAARFAAGTGETPPLLSFAGSSALARQIMQGAPAALFVSANTAWMDTLEAEGLIAPGTRADIATGDLVLIAAPGYAGELTIGPGFDLAGALGGERLAMALVDAVPAGIYGRAALQSLGVWDSVADRIAQADNVRAALRLVALGEAPLGIVYATDALAEPRVRVLGRFPPDSHPPICYPAAVLAEFDTPPARAFLAFLTGPEGREILNRHGFGSPDRTE